MFCHAFRSGWSSLWSEVFIGETYRPAPGMYFDDVAMFHNSGSLRGPARPAAKRL